MNSMSRPTALSGDRKRRDDAGMIRRRRVAGLVVGALATILAPASSAGAVTVAQRTEQIRYAKETMALGNRQFAERKANFLAAGCGSVADCTKPAPYHHQFDWNTDSCSGPVPMDLRNLFHPACQQHDFGYRNFGKGLTLGRDEGTRRWIDDRFRTELKSICNYRFSDWTKYANLQACFKEADAMYLAVRVASTWSTPVLRPAIEPPHEDLPAPATTFPETSGSPARTWTDPQNAGGAPGPVIARGTTVEIACRIDGFRVANGNTAWYRIASSPWNSTYWVSADAFYNNGAVSGSLRGTPFFDEHVPFC